MDVNGKDYPILIVENKKNVPNHQPEMVSGQFCSKTPLI